MSDKRDPRVDPKPGDVLAGPLLQLQVEAITDGLFGVESIRARMGTRKGGYFPGDATRTFTEREWRAFIHAGAEVLHAADAGVDSAPE